MISIKHNTKSFEELTMEYLDWIKENWNTAGGLVTQAQAARMLNKTRTRIRQMINERKLTPYQYEKEAPLISFAELSKIAKEKN